MQICSLVDRYKLQFLEKYIQIFPNEKDRQDKLINFLNKQDENKITDWNNFEGHIVASGFIYAKKEKKFLVLYQYRLTI